MSLQPYSGPFNQAELQHLLRRTLFGVSPADLAHFSGMSLGQVVNELLTFTNNTTPPIKAYTGQNNDPNGIDPDVAFGTPWINVVRDPLLQPNPNLARAGSFAYWWMGQMLDQERNIREKMVLFWQNHLATEAGGVIYAEPIYHFNQLFRDNCLGNFRSLMYDVTVHEAMLIYLNGYLNITAAPDENYARELMELFTLGVNSGYTEDDVHAAARVLTGWTIRFTNAGQPIHPTTAFIPFNHDSNDKQFSAFFNNQVIAGQTGPPAGQNEVNALLDMIFAKEEVSKFICRKIYRFFVHSDIDATVEADVIEPLALTFRNNVGAPDQMKTVMQALLTSECFFDPAIRGCMVRSPIDYLVGNIRTFGVDFPDPTTQFEGLYLEWRDAYFLTAVTGQDPTSPPNVAGWPAYYQYPQYDHLWLDTSSYGLRKAIYEYLAYVGFSTPANLYQTASQNLSNPVDFVAFVGQFSDPADPNELINEAVELLFATEISQSIKDQLKTNYLLLGQSVDYYWTQAYIEYTTNPSTTDPAALLVPDLLKLLFADMMGAAEHQLF